MVARSHRVDRRMSKSRQDASMSQVAATQSSSTMQADYMRLLVAQLRHQNPLEPLDNNEMASQMALFSQLQQLETMNSSFSRVLRTVERDYAGNLLGKVVSFVGDTGMGVSGVLSGVVETVYNDVDGDTVLSVGDHAVSLKDVIAVQD